jgi:hypothetical protein
MSPGSLLTKGNLYAAWEITPSGDVTESPTLVGQPNARQEERTQLCCSSREPRQTTQSEMALQGLIYRSAIVLQHRQVLMGRTVSSGPPGPI